VGTNASLIVYADGDPRQVLRSSPAMDRLAARDLVLRLFPEHAIEETGDADLMDVLSADLGRAYAGCYPGLAIVCHSGLGRDRPSGLPQHILGARPYRRIYLIAMISFFDCAAVAAWHDGQLRRSLSVTFNGQLADPPVTGEIVENSRCGPGTARTASNGSPSTPSTLERPRSPRFSAFPTPGACLTQLVT